MARPLPPHRATYRLLGPDGTPVGTESLGMTWHDSELRVESRLALEDPAVVSADLRWELDESLRTRLLRISGTNGAGDDYELELALTGNGLLAHRRAPDGPTQVEMGWGPSVELDYLSAAFPAVMAARSRLAVYGTRAIACVVIGAEDLVPLVVERELRRLHDDDTGARIFDLRTPSTGHSATLTTSPGGVLRSYAGLLDLLEFREG